MFHGEGEPPDREIQCRTRLLLPYLGNLTNNRNVLVVSVKDKEIPMYIIYEQWQSAVFFMFRSPPVKIHLIDLDWLSWW